MTATDIVSPFLKKLLALRDKGDVEMSHLMQQALQCIAVDRGAKSAFLLLEEGAVIVSDNGESLQVQERLQSKAPTWLARVATGGPNTYTLAADTVWSATLPLHSPLPIAALILHAPEAPPSEAWLNAILPLLTSLLYESRRPVALREESLWLPTISTALTKIRKLIVNLLDADTGVVFYPDLPLGEGSQLLAPGKCQQLLDNLDTSLIPEDLLHLSDTESSDHPLARIAWSAGQGTTLVIPVQKQGTTGAVIVCRQEVRPFSQEEQRRGRILAQHVGFLLHTMSQIQERSTRESLIEVLASAAQMLTQSLALDDVLDQILAQLAQVVPHDASNVMLIDQEHEQVEIVRWRGYEAFGVEDPQTELVLPLTTPSFQQMQATGEPLLVQDTRTEPAWVARASTDWQRSYVGAPIIIDDEVVGFVNVGSTQPDFFTLKDARTLGTFAVYVALALKNARYFERNRRRQHYLEQVAVVTAAINRASKLEDILEIGLQRTMEMTGMQQGGIYIWNPDANRLELHVQRAYPAARIERLRQRHPEACIIDRAFSEQQVVIEDGEILAEEENEDVACNIGVPLLAEGEAVGVLNLVCRGTRTLDQDVLPFLHTITNQLALAIRRTELSHQLRQQVQTLQYLYEASAGLMTQTERTGAAFILLRTLYDTLPHAMSVAFYTIEEDVWRRTKVYARRAALTSPLWQEGETWTGEDEFLFTCQRQRIPIIVSQRRGTLPSFWEGVERAGAQQLLYYPLTLPTGEFFGVVAIALRSARHMPPQESALTQALIQQGTAALTRIRLYEKSRKEESRLRAILGSSRDGIFLVGKERIIHYVNEQALSLLELPGRSSDWEGRAFADVTANIYEHIPALAEWFLHRSRFGWSEGNFQTESRSIFETPQGRALTPYHWPVYSQQESLMGALFLIRDVTEQQTLEQMRDDFLHMLVHDMRNPLSVIINALHLLEDPNLEDAAEEVSQLAKENARRMLTFINAILDVNKIESGQLALHSRPTNLAERLDFVKQHLLVSAKDIELSVAVPETLPSAQIDPDVIQRVFQNLLDNAFKFVPEREGVIRITARQQGEWIEMEVFNNGPPLPEALRNRLFQKFTMGEHANQGYGLGLAFCRLAVEAHGGEIWAENHPEQGVSFYFTLPIAEP